MGSFLLSCSPNKVGALPEENEDIEPLEIGYQLRDAVTGGLSLDIDQLSLKIPGKIEGKDNNVLIENGSINLRIDEPSIHGINASIDLPLDYNGLKREANLTLKNESLYFSLSWPNDGGIKFKTNVTAYDESEEDELTRGIVYYEYGSLDYFVYSVLESFDIKEISLKGGDGEKLAFDFEEFREATNHMVSLSEHYFRLDLPLGEDTLSFGLGSNEKGILNHVDFPLDNENNLSSFSFNDGFEISLSADINPSESPSFTLPYEEEDYLVLGDSLALVKEIGNKISHKKFGISANLDITHIEEEVIGDDTHFARDEIEEDGHLDLSANVDLSTSYNDVTGEVDFSSNGNDEYLALHIEEEEGEGKAYINLNNILKAKTNIKTLSNFASSTGDALSDESIQNDTIMKVLSGFLVSLGSLSEAIDAIKESVVYTDINEGHYEGLISMVTSLTHANNEIYATLDLSKANGRGKAYVTLSSNNLDLLSVTFESAGIVSSSSPKLSLILDGTLEVMDYEETAFDKTGYTELEHLPGLEDTINDIAENDQLSISLSGYFAKKGETAVTSYTLPSYNGNKTLDRQGFSFSGSLGFDLAEKIGTGKATITDHKEHFFQDHNLKVDVTGPSNETDSALKDYQGNEGDTGYMLVEYNSKNNSSKSAEKRTEPEGNPLKGRFSINSLNDVLDTVASLLSSTDPRFKRLTNSFSSLTSRTVLGALIDGRYLEVLASGFLLSANINNATRTDTFVIKQGVIHDDYPLNLRLKFAENYTDSEGIDRVGKLETIEVYANSVKSDGNEIYVKIDFDSTDFSVNPPDYNWIGSSYSLNDFISFSSLSHLVSFLLGTITLGVTDESYLTTYHLNASIPLKILTKTYNIDIDAFIYLDGAHIKLAANVTIPEIKPVGIVDVVSENTYTNIYYETNGDDSSGELYMERIRIQKNTLTSDKTYSDKVRVKGSDFSDNLLDWLLKYILNMGSIITDNLSGDSSSKQSIHGEDLIQSFSTSGSFENPVWNLSISMKALTHVSMFENLDLTINGKTVTYSSNGKNYSKESLYSASGSLALKIIGISAASATLSLSIKNITSIGKYENAWNSSSHKLTMFTGTKSSGTLWKRYTVTTQSSIPSSVFDSKFASRTSLGYTVKP